VSIRVRCRRRAQCVLRKPFKTSALTTPICPTLAQDGSGAGSGGPRGQAEGAGEGASASGKDSAADSPWFKLSSWRALLDALDLPVGLAATLLHARSGIYMRTASSSFSFSSSSSSPT
jgi:hypothetical protein